jgi:hypothetical protein
VFFGRLPALFEKKRFLGDQGAPLGRKKTKSKKT